MTRRRAFLALLIAFFLIAAKRRAVGSPDALLHRPLPDAFSFAEPSRAAVRHLSLDLTVDFDAHVVRGTAALQVENLTGTRELVLDTQSLAIESIAIDGIVTGQWSKGVEDTWGAPLRVEIPPGTSVVAIRYASDPFAPGLFWTTDQDVSVYSLNIPSRARSWIPIQDTPSVRMTYDATLRVPPGQLALMTAGDNPRSANSDGVYRFAMQQSVPAYLIAFAAGHLQHHAFDARTGVYAPPGLIADAVRELQDLPAIVAAAEQILGPLPFPRHDILIVSSPFVFLGMEHPMLNFIHASWLTAAVNGDPDADVLIAHELSHSWAGDATTLSTWSDVWLNEGFASYLALRIIEETSGASRAEAKFARDRRDYEAAIRDAEPSTTILHRVGILAPSAAFDLTSYKKASCSCARSKRPSAARPSTHFSPITSPASRSAGSTTVTSSRSCARTSATRG